MEQRSPRTGGANIVEKRDEDNPEVPRQASRYRNQPRQGSSSSQGINNNPVNNRDPIDQQNPNQEDQALQLENQ